MSVVINSYQTGRPSSVDVAVATAIEHLHVFTQTRSVPPTRVEAAGA
jgi:hypothetical protein